MISGTNDNFRSFSFSCQTSMVSILIQYKMNIEHEKEIAISNNNLEQPNQEGKILRGKSPASTAWCPILTIEFYQPFFDVDQEEIRRRLRCAFIPLKPEFFSVIGTNPDLWGPVWITTTIIFLLFAAGNLSNYLSSYDKAHFHYEYNFVPIALAVVYGIGFVIPSIVTLILKFLAADIKLVDVICLYGYSMVWYVPILIACVIPYNIAQWLFLVWCTVISTTFILWNFWTVLQKIGPKKIFPIVTILVFQVGILLIYKLYFFHLIDLKVEQ